MQAITVRERDAGLAGLSLTEVPYPHAAENDVIVRVHAAGIHPRRAGMGGDVTDRAGRHVGHGRIAEKDHAQSPAGTAEQAGPVTLNLAVHQDVKTEPVAVERRLVSRSRTTTTE